MEILKENQMQEYDEFLAGSENGHLMQSRQWANLKNNWKFSVVVRRNADGKIIGSAGALIRKMPKLPYTLIYVPRGPICDYSDEKTVNNLLCDLKQLGVENKACSVKIDPAVRTDNEKFKSILAANGFVNLHAGSKNFESTQPSFVFRLDVKNKTMDELMAAFHQKTRYNIRVAQKNGVVVEMRDKSAIPDFYAIMSVTGLRDGFTIRPQAYFERMLDCLGENARLYMAYLDGKPVAGTIAARYGNKVWYLYGASSNEYRNVMPNYLLQLEMIRWAVDSGCDIYDFRGVSGDLDPSNHLYGLYRFKKGFSGELCEFVGEYDLLLRPFMYKMMQCGRKLLAKLHK